MIQTFSNKAVAENIYLGFDFSNRLSTGETISTATFTNVVIQSVDSGASSMVFGTATINAGIVQSMIKNGVAGNTYELSVVVNTSGNRILYAKAQYQVQ